MTQKNQKNNEQHATGRFDTIWTIWMSPSSKNNLDINATKQSRYTTKQVTEKESDPRFNPHWKQNAHRKREPHIILQVVFTACNLARKQTSQHQPRYFIKIIYTYMSLWFLVERLYTNAQS